MAVRSPAGRPRPGGAPRAPSAARHHADWLNLVEQSGPFLGLTSLLRVFAAGLDADDSDLRRDLRAVYAEWRDNQGGVSPDPEIHQLWVRWALTQVLGLADHLILTDQAIPPTLALDVPEQGERLRPTAVLTTPQGRPDANTPRLLIQVEPAGRELEQPIPDRRWTASPAVRMGLLLQGSGVRLGLVTNGEQWMLVNASPGEAVGYASWYSALWLDEPITLQAFRSLLGQARFFGVPNADTLEEMLSESASDQVEVTDQLGLQVRTAVEVLVRALDRADQDRHRELLAGLAAREVYHAGLTVMMRLVFLMSAEERGLFLLGDQLYDEHYAISTLRGQLREAADSYGEDVLERRFDAWARLLATFRAVFGGVEHEALRLPAYGGDLFDPDRFPFLEGRLAGSSWRDTNARPLPISNRTVLHLLEALQILQVRVPGGGAEARRLSFRALDVEQIGHVYEGLLDHTARRAERPLLQLQAARTKATRGGEPTVSLVELEAAAQQGRPVLLTLLKERTGRSGSSLEKALAPVTDGPTLSRLLQACGNDQPLRDRALPYLGLVAVTDDGYPAVVLPGGLYVGAGADRRGSGTHYTPRSLTEPIVRYALEPLVYHGPADGLPAEQWTLRSPRELLELKVCDPAMGSGAFLVQACRYLSERLVEAWDTAEKRLARSQEPGVRSQEGAPPQITPYGELSAGDPSEMIMPRDAAERLIMARRLVADSCLYGVDKNPMAVEMAKMSLWLTTLDHHRPFTFLDHALKAGDSLVGTTHVEQIEQFHPYPSDTGARALVVPLTRSTVAAAARDMQTLRRIRVFSVDDVYEKQRVFARIKIALVNLRIIGDLVAGVAVATSGKGTKVLNQQIGSLTPFVLDAIPESSISGSSLWRDDQGTHLELARKRAADLLLPAFGSDDDEGGPAPVSIHWPIEFPEVFNSADASPRGFDAIVGNPPFMGGQKITGNLGTHYRDYLVQHIANGARGSADLAAYFVLRIAALLRAGGKFGILATNTIAQGDTREVGLRPVVLGGHVITRAVASRKWPGVANLEISHIWLRQGKWGGPFMLDDRPVSGITPSLTAPGKVDGPPKRLLANDGKSYQGAIVLGMGFVMSPAEAQALIDRDPRNAEVLFPYLNGQDINLRWDQSAPRWIINFRDWPLEQAEHYPECIEIVRRLVKPERATNNRAVYRDRWWHYAEKRPDLVNAIANQERVLVRSQVSDRHMLTFLPTGAVFDQRLVVLTFDRFHEFALLQSTIHDMWGRAYSSSIRTDMSYTPTDCFLTFPFPESLDSLEEIGERYYTHRQGIMTARQEGLTKTYNRVHKPDEQDADIQRLRELRMEMDHAVAAAYGWADLQLEHGFHQTAQGLRFTISEAARREVLERLLILNHQRYDAEVAAGLHENAKGKKKTSPPSPLSGAERGGSAGGRGKKKLPPAGHTLSLLDEEPSA